MIAGLGVLYVVCGVGVVVAVRVRRPVGPADICLLLVCWPLYAPFVLVVENAVEAPELDLTGQVRSRLQRAEDRANQIAELLRQPEFSATATQARIDTLMASGHEAAATTARASLRNIERVERLHTRCCQELTEVRELMIQLQTQTQVMRVAGSGSAETRALVAELVTRAESLDAVLDDADLFEDAA